MNAGSCGEASIIATSDCGSSSESRQHLKAIRKTITGRLSAKPFIKSHSLKHTLPLLMANQTSLSYSSGSPVYAPLKRVGTHNGSFHCDEALGCFMIRLTHEFNNAEIVRTRDPKETHPQKLAIMGEEQSWKVVLSFCIVAGVGFLILPYVFRVLEGLDAVLDVGGVYDPAQDRYDHHQKGFEEVFGHGFSTKLSSAGLVYKHFGKEIIAKELKVDEVHHNVHQIYLAVYKSFVEELTGEEQLLNRLHWIRDTQWREIGLEGTESLNK
ncbi:hypothetical protein V8G54_010179 [Vigna mungo]|uniref:Metal-dependent protein hydrolase n=1 Tax=Vigna mungo TaxID=3915 RepID=A0AAQ3NYL7_VIGMU